MKWTWDERALNKINSAFSSIGFPSLKKMIDTQSKIFFCKCSHALFHSNILRNNYRKILKVIDKADGQIEFDKEKVSDNILSGALEWMMISNKEDLHFIMKEREACADWMMENMDEILEAQKENKKIKKHFELSN